MSSFIKTNRKADRVAYSTQSQHIFLFFHGSLRNESGSLTGLLGQQGQLFYEITLINKALCY